MVRSLGILRGRAAVWKDSVKNMRDSPFVNPVITQNRTFMERLARVGTLQEYCQLVNEFGTTYLVNERQMEAICADRHMPNERRIKKIIKDLLNELGKL